MKKLGTEVVKLIVAQREHTYVDALAVCQAGGVEKGKRGLEKLVRLVEALGDSSSCARYLQGGVLARIKSEELWRSEAPDLSFKEWVRDHLSMGDKFAEQLILLNERSVTLGLTIAQLEKIGWTKMREILRIADAESIAEWLEIAKTTALSEIIRLVADAKRAGSHAPVKKGRHGDAEDDVREAVVTFKVRVTEEEKANIEATVSQAQEAMVVRKGFQPNPGAALDLICVEWGANHLDGNRALEWHLGHLERVYGVSLKVLKTGEKVRELRALPAPNGGDEAHP